MTGLGADILTSPIIAKACAPTSSLVFDVPSTELNNGHLKQLKPRTNANNQVFPWFVVKRTFT
jgi:hypothetical protein